MSKEPFPALLGKWFFACSLSTAFLIHLIFSCQKPGAAYALFSFTFPARYRIASSGVGISPWRGTLFWYAFVISLLFSGFVYASVRAVCISCRTSFALTPCFLANSRYIFRMLMKISSIVKTIIACFFRL